LGCDIIVSVGGDIITYEVLNGIMKLGQRKNRKKCALAILPLGSRNNFSKHLGFHKETSYENLITMIFSGFCIPIDIGSVMYTSFTDKNVKKTTYFLNSSTFGSEKSLGMLEAVKYAKKN